MKKSVDHPSHYTKGKIECIEAIRESLGRDGFIDYCRGNVMKYVWRCRDKDGLLIDLEKAEKYLSFAIKELKRKSKCK